jgi:cyclase
VLTALAFASVSMRGQAPPPYRMPDFNKVEIKVSRLAGQVYRLEGEGGATGVLVGPDGVLMVDSQWAPLTEKLVAAVRQISDGRIRFLVNTHFTAITPAAMRISAASV